MKTYSLGIRIAIKLLVLGFVNVFAQTTCYETAVLPTDSVWGGKDQVGSVLIGNTYNAGQGPGIYIVADGGYRLYLNGELLGYDQAAGRVRFIPMTFLPMKNVISIVGINGQNAPGVLMHLDELEKPYVTGATWKASTTLADNSWKSKTFSDVAWANASVQSSGSLTQTPSGLAISGFPANSTAQWIWSGNAKDNQVMMRYTFNIKAVGFGESTTGGDGGQIVVAKTTQEIIKYLKSRVPLTILVPEGTYDFRNVRNDAKGTWPWCTRHCYTTETNSSNNFNIISTSGICPSGETIATNVPRWETYIPIKSNKSLLGMGRGAKLRAASIYMFGDVDTASNAIFRNLAIYDMDPHLTQALDAIGAQSSNKLWIDHVSIKWVSRGFMLAGSTGMKEVSLSYIHYDGSNPYSCQGNDPFVSLFYDTDVTLSYNHWHNTCGRVPKTLANFRTMRVHVLNSYVDSNTFFVAQAEGKSASIRSQVLLENNLIHNATGWPIIKSPYGLINSKNNSWTGKTGTFVTMDSTGAVHNSVEPHDAVFTPPYFYTLETPSNLDKLLTTNAGIGGKWGSMPQYSDVGGFANTTPSVFLSSPSNGAIFSAPANLTLSASAFDLGGNVTKVEFYSGTGLIGTATSSPYSIPVSFSGNCIYSVVAIAYDNNGLKATSLPLTFQVSSCIPTISAGGPTKFCQGGNVVLTASPGKTYQWFNGVTPLGTGSSYTATSSGNYTVAVTSSSGCMSPSNGTIVTVEALPSISITSPLNNSTINSDTVIIKTTTSSKVSGVFYYEGNKYLGMVATSPFNYKALNIANGNYIFSAVAQSGNCTNTATVNVNVAKLISGISASNLLNDGFYCFPNPFTDVFQIQASGIFTYSICDMAENELVKGGGENVVSASTNFKAGIYLVKIQNGIGSKVFKITKN